MEAGITSFGYDSGRAFDDFLKKTGVLELPGAKDASRNDWTKWLNPGWDAKAGKWNWETDKSQTANTTFRDRERQLADAEENLRKETASARLTAVKDNWTRDLQREATAQQSRLMFGSNDNALTFGADTFYTAAREAAQAKAGHTMGYGRPEEQADIARRSGFAESLAVQQGSAARVMGGLTRQHELDQGFTSGLEKQVAAQQAEVARRRADVDKFKDVRGAGTIDAEASYKAREDLEASQQRLTALQDQLTESRKKGLEDEKSIIEQINETGKQRIQTLKGMRDAESGVIEQERARKQSVQESFGLMLPGEKALALRSARDVAGGRRIDRQEFEFMRAHDDLFGDSLRRMGAANAGPVFQEVYKLLGKEERGRQEEQTRLQLDNQIKVEIAGVDKHIADEITAGVMPEIKKVIADVATKFEQELAKIQNQINRARLGAGQ